LVGLLAGASLVTGCITPALSQDGQLVFTPGASRSAILLTASGVEYTDREDVHPPRVRTSPYDPYEPPRGFLLPQEGRFRHVAAPIEAHDGSLSLSLRAGDALVPAWGGEMLVRLDLIARGGEEHAPLHFIVVFDGQPEALDTLGCQATSRLFASDRAALIDSRGARTLVSAVPGAQRALLSGAIHQRHALTATRDLSGALAAAKKLVEAHAGEHGLPRVLLLTDGEDLETHQAAIDALKTTGAQLFTARPGDQMGFPESALAAREISLSLTSSPAPARLIDGSGGKRAALPDEDLLFLGNLSAGQGRSEIVRLVLPTSTGNAGYRLAATVRYTDPASGEERHFHADLDLRYSDDPDAIATHRAADVIAYGSELALVGKIDRAFLGTAASSVSGLRDLVEYQRRSLLMLGGELRDGSPLRDQAEILHELVWAL
jgi:hypothetical protein